MDDLFRFWIWPIAVGLIVAFLLALLRWRMSVQNKIGGAAQWLKPSGLRRSPISLAVGESAYIASSPYTPDREVKDIVLQVMLGNSSGRDETIMTFRINLDSKGTIPVSEARWSDRGNNWILIPPGGGFSSIPQKDYHNPPITVPARQAFVGWIGFCLLEGRPRLTLEEAADVQGQVIATLADGRELMASLPSTTLPIVSEEPK